MSCPGQTAGDSWNKTRRTLILVFSHKHNTLPSLRFSNPCKSIYSLGWMCRHYISQFVTNPTHKDMHFYSSVSAIIFAAFSSCLYCYRTTKKMTNLLRQIIPQESGRMKKGLLSLFNLRNQIFIILLRFYLVALRNPA